MTGYFNHRDNPFPSYLVMFQHLISIRGISRGKTLKGNTVISTHEHTEENRVSESGLKKKKEKMGRLVSHDVP